jgi:hypothetical protein
MPSPEVEVSYEHPTGQVVLAVEGSWTLEFLSVNNDGKTYLTLRPKRGD